MKRRKLPIGIQDLRTIRETDSYYVDKTPFIRQLIEEGRYYFFARPRQFGKSLLLDTIKSLFEGEEELFRGLDIHGHWDWSVRNPVLRLSFPGKCGNPEEIDRNIMEQLESVERRHGLDPAPASGTGPRRLRNVLDRLHHATGQRVVVLVDEFDKPVLDALHDPDLAAANHDYLLGFYGIIKGSSEHVHFTFVTGISMMPRAGIFSGLNHLNDISLDRRYATICGFTETDLDEVFAPELEGLDREEIRTRYNGYHWPGGERVYNPHDVLMLLERREFRPYWFASGSQTFLYETLNRHSVSLMELENRVVDRSLITRFELDSIGAEALMFQTGYLTIAEEMEEGYDTLYRLDYPNREVCMSLNNGLLSYLKRPSTDTKPSIETALFGKSTDRIRPL